MLFADHSGFHLSPNELFEKAISTSEASALWLFSRYPSLSKPETLIKFIEPAVNSHRPIILKRLIHVLLSTSFGAQSIGSSQVNLKESIWKYLDLAVAWVAWENNAWSKACLRVLVFGDSAALVSEGMTKDRLDKLILHLKYQGLFKSG